MQWSEVITNPFLKNLPFKIELNKWGKIEMSPASNQHGRSVDSTFERQALSDQS